MPERDGYIPGVPCWVDTSQPDPEAAVDFYAGLFGWTFENVMPPASGGKYFIARLHGGTVAAVGSAPASAPSTASWDTYVSVASADETAARVARRGRERRDRACRRHGRRPDGCLRRSRRSVVLCLAGRSAQGCAGGQRSGVVELQRPQHARRRRREVVLRLGVRLGDAFDGRRRDVDAAGYGDDLERNDPGIRRRVAEVGGPVGFEDVVASINPIPGDQPARPAALERDVRDRRRRRPSPRRRTSSAARSSSLRSTLRGSA